MSRSRFAVPALVALTASGVLSSALTGAGPASAAPLTTAVPLTTAAPPAIAASPAAGVRSAARTSPPADPAWESVLVAGTGEVFGEPDTLNADFAVETTATTVGAALDQAVAASARTRDALVRAGVARADLKTTNVSIGSTQDGEGKTKGYTVSQGLTVTIRNLPKAGSLMTAAIKAGGDAARLNGVSFGIEKNTALLAEARKKAFADARSKAELYAREAGRPLGRVVRISEPAFGYAEPARRDKMTAAMAAMDMSVPIEPGRQRLSVTVTVEWVLASAAA